MHQIWLDAVFLIKAFFSSILAYFCEAFHSRRFALLQGRHEMFELFNKRFMNTAQMCGPAHYSQTNPDSSHSNLVNESFFAVVLLICITSRDTKHNKLLMT